MKVLVIIMWVVFVGFMLTTIVKNILELRAITSNRQLIDKACEWLSEQGKEWWEGYGIPFTIENFRKAMKDESTF